MKANLENTWYNVHDENKIITPGLLISPEKIKDNIKAMIQISGTADRLWPHIKTYMRFYRQKLQIWPFL